MSVKGTSANRRPVSADRRACTVGSAVWSAAIHVKSMPRWTAFAPARERQSATVLSLPATCRMSVVNSDTAYIWRCWRAYKGSVTLAMA